LEVNLVELTSISKTFERRRGIGFRFFFSLLFGNKNSLNHNSPSDNIKYFFALNNLSLRVQKNKSIGIIGENGAGKSTLLQIISGTLSASSGTVKVNGRVASLLELGSGFDPNFTGRENVVLNASILGLSKVEIANRITSIMDFADIGEFIDKPVKSYSSGMTLRLAFAVIAHVDADLLIIDEALAVGDAVFIQKCMRFIRDFQKKGP
jgi:lipopolysaccharide transport system ATP-binding protein